MSSTIDTNVLLSASDTSSSRHAGASRLLEDLARGPDLVYVFWPVAMAHLRIATHPSVFERPLEPATAQATIWTSDRNFRRFPSITVRNPDDWPGR